MSGPIRSQLGPANTTLIKWLAEAGEHPLIIDQTQTPSQIKTALQASLIELRHDLNKLQSKALAINGLHERWMDLMSGYGDAAREREDATHATFIATTPYLNTLEQAHEKIALLASKKEEMEGILGEINASIAARAPRHVVALNDPAAAASHRGVKLPKLELLKYKGDPLQWTRFWAQFSAAIHLNAELDYNDKFSYLEGLLEGPAAALIEGFTPSEANYKAAIDLLQRRCGNEGIVIDSLHDKLAGLKCSDDNFNHFVEQIEGICRQLEGLGESCGSKQIERAIMRALPRSIKLKIIEAKHDDDTWGTTALRKKLLAMAECNAELNRDQKRSNPDKNSGGKPQQQGFQQSRQHNTPGFKKGYEAQIVMANTEPTKLTRPCRFCNQNHFDRECDKYTTPQQRSERAKELNLCFNCLRDNHRTGECRGIYNCYYCDKRHHSLLCFSKKTDQGVPAPKGAPQPATSQSTSAEKAQPKKYGKGAAKPKPATKTTDLTSAPVVEEVAHLTTTPNLPVLLAAAKVVICNPKAPDQLFKVCAVLDSMSHRSFISQKAVDYLKLDLNGKDFINISGLNATPIKDSSFPKTEVQLQLCDGTPKDLQVNVVPTITKPITTVLPTSRENDTNPSPIELQHVTWEEAKSIVPDILIGGDYFWGLLQPGYHHMYANGLRAVSTSIGPILVGKSNSDNSGDKNSSGAISMVSLISAEDDSKSSVPETTLWDLDSIGITEDPHEDDRVKAMELFEASFKKIGNQCSVRLPWKTEKPNLPTNYGLAKGRFCSMFERLWKNPQRLKACDDVVQAWHSGGYTETVEPSQIPEGVLHYLSLVDVSNEDSSTTPVRLCADASAAKPGQPSLNDVIYQGPTILPSLTGMLIRFRQEDIVVSADVEKAFLQIGLESCDRDACRFFWVKDITKPLTWSNIQIFRFTRICFGINASPFLLGAVSHKHLSYYEIGPQLARNLYVDNLIFGAANQEEALRKYGSTKAIFHACGMNLRKFICSDPEVMKKIPEADRCKDTKLKVLGVPWDLPEDNIRVAFPTVPDEPITKRKVLSIAHSLFDPLGLASPTTVDIKLFIQDLWLREVQWDEVLSQDDQTRWKNIAKAWLGGDLIMPRRTPHRPRANTDYELHGYCDASHKAYACAIFLKATTGRWCDIQLVFAKCRIRPAKKGKKKEAPCMGTPKLELLAARIGAQALTFVGQELDKPLKRSILWSDSAAVVAWVHSSPEKILHQQRFIKSSIDKIHGHGHIVRHVPGKDNPADIGSRGATADELRRAHSWWQGPEWLRHSETAWPRTEPLPIMEVELLTVDASQPMSPFIEMTQIDRVNDYYRLKRITAYALRFIKQVVSKKKDKLRNLVLKKAIGFPVLTSRLLGRAELLQAETLLLLTAQATHPPESRGDNELALYEDEYGLLRCGGRLGECELDPAAVHQIYLHHRSPLAKPLVQAIHEGTNHIGVNQTLSELRRGYWITRGRDVVSRAVSRCHWCKKMKATPYCLGPMGKLPPERVTRAVAFTHIGVDYLGPTLVQDKGRDASKHWVAIFTCMATRATHLESVPDLTTLAFINALRRMTAIRGRPSLIWSDNATTFKAANMVEQVIWTERVREEELMSYLADGCIEWKFIVDYAPWQGGFYEAMVKITKTNYRRAVGRHRLTYENFRTLLAEIMAIMNTRPLTYLTANSATLPTLCPLDLFCRINKPGFPVLEEDWENASVYVERLTTQERFIDEVRKSTKIIDRFWELWHQDYLPALREQHKQVHKSQRLDNPGEPRVGEIVHLFDGDLPRGHWKLARVDQINRGHDGFIRSAVVTTASGKSYKRPINHLYSLEVPDSHDEDANKPADEEIPEPDGEVNVAVPAFEELVERSTAGSILPRPKWPFFLLLLSLLMGGARTGD